MASESKKPHSPNPNPKHSHVSNEIRELSPLTTNMCPLELEDNGYGFGNIDNDEFVDNVGPDSGSELQGDDENLGLLMSNIVTPLPRLPVSLDRKTV
ncbi:hypothetical protein E5676_scaffold21G001190 [Cucumis melo var. makuwa]|uniref:Uncharacterized protein n=1 Tax=Cucumis melo var. makuwa TaxID=1194695 RepID=A0A5D3CWR6_CUCMM|nr:hypothetical protein E5676_scaffold21G001190 [Cucumis melo var. makuwa]